MMGFPRTSYLLGRIQSITEVQKPHKIVLGHSLPVILIGVFVAWVGFSDRPETIAKQEDEISGETPVRATQIITPKPGPIPSATDTVLTKLRLGTEPGAFLMSVRQVQGVVKVEFDAKSSTLAVTHLPSGPGAKAMAALAMKAGLVVQGEVMDLPLALETTHLETCGSCGLVIYEQLQKTRGVHAVEVFLPIKNQLRLLIEPASNTASGIADFINQSRHPATP